MSVQCVEMFTALRGQKDAWFCWHWMSRYSLVWCDAGCAT